MLTSRNLIYSQPVSGAKASRDSCLSRRPAQEFLLKYLAFVCIRVPPHLVDTVSPMSLSQPGGTAGHTSRQSTCATPSDSSALAPSFLELNPCSISRILLNFPTLEGNGAEEINSLVQRMSTHRPFNSLNQTACISQWWSI